VYLRHTIFCSYSLYISTLCVNPETKLQKAPCHSRETVTGCESKETLMQRPRDKEPKVPRVKGLGTEMLFARDLFTNHEEPTVSTPVTTEPT